VLAVPKGEDDEMELFVSTQNPTETQVYYYWEPNRDSGIQLPRIQHRLRYTITENPTETQVYYYPEPQTQVYNYPESNRDPVILPRTQQTPTMYVCYYQKPNRHPGCYLPKNW
jgi:hypothetical protein